MARKKSTKTQVKTLVERFAADLLPLLRQKAEEEIARMNAQQQFAFAEEPVEYQFVDGGTLGESSRHDSVVPRENESDVARVVVCNLGESVGTEYDIGIPETVPPEADEYLPNG